MLKSFTCLLKMGNNLDISKATNREMEKKTSK